MYLKNITYRGQPVSTISVEGTDSHTYILDRRVSILPDSILTVNSSSLTMLELHKLMLERQDEIYNMVIRGRYEGTSYLIVKSATDLDIEMRKAIVIRQQKYNLFKNPGVVFYAVDACDTFVHNVNGRFAVSFIDFFLDWLPDRSGCWISCIDRYLKVDIVDFKLFEKVKAKYKMIRGK